MTPQMRLTFPSQHLRDRIIMIETEAQHACTTSLLNVTLSARMYYLVGKARPQRTLPRSLHLPPPMWFSSGSSHRPNPLPPLPVDQAFASSQGRRPQQQPHPLGPLCLATFNIGLTLDVTGSAQKDTKEPKLRKDLKALAKALNHCEKFKTTCIVVTQHVCPRPPPGPLSLNEWFHVPGTIHQVAHIICLQEVSERWFSVARTSVPHGWSGWWYDRLGILWDRQMVHCQETPQVCKVFPDSRGAKKSFRYYAQVACVLKL